jgi:hypothetical protein
MNHDWRTYGTPEVLGTHLFRSLPYALLLLYRHTYMRAFTHMYRHVQWAYVEVSHRQCTMMPRTHIHISVDALFFINSHSETHEIYACPYRNPESGTIHDIFSIKIFHFWFFHWTHTMILAVCSLKLILALCTIECLIPIMNLKVPLKMLVKFN